MFRCFLDIFYGKVIIINMIRSVSLFSRRRNWILRRLNIKFLSFELIEVEYVVVWIYNLGYIYNIK